MSTPEPHLTVAEVARRLGLSRSFAYQIVKSEIGYVQHGRALRVPVENLDRYLARFAVNPPALHATTSKKISATKLRNVAPTENPKRAIIKPTYPRTKPRVPPDAK